MAIKEYFGDWAHIVDLREAERVMAALKPKASVLCPRLKDVFKAFRLCPYRDLRLVIIGQDPYPQVVNGSPIAQGLAFAVPNGFSWKSFPPSLKVLTESVIDFSVPHHAATFAPCLEDWARQGVLLLNAALTCEAGRPEAHALLWRPFMVSLLKSLSLYSNGLVYLLMGSCAKSLSAYISHDGNHVFETRHPAWYARSGQKMPSRLWHDINSILKGQNGYGIKFCEEAYGEQESEERLS